MPSYRKLLADVLRTLDQLVLQLLKVRLHQTLNLLLHLLQLL